MIVVSTPRSSSTAETNLADGAAGPAKVDRLRGCLDLDLYLPGEQGYDAARASWNSAVEHRPLAVAVPHSVDGVIEVVAHARRHRVSLAIQSAGHGPTRAARDAILLNMRRMNDVHLDADRRRVRIGGGAKWQAVLDVVTPHGLAPLLGSTPDVSAVGYTLGGGIGWLARKYGTSADSVHAFEVVTADGRLIRTTAEEHPDLFWALRGAGAGHLGVVTSMVIELYPIKELYAGSLLYPAHLAVEVLQHWRDWLPTVPEALTSAATMLNFPPDNDVPPELRGESFVLIRGGFDGSAEDGERLLSYWRSWRRPEIDMFGPLPFSRIAEISQDPLDPVPYEGTGLWLRSLSDDSIAELVDAMFPQEGSSLLVQAELRHAQGALARGSSQSSAYGNRDASMLLELVGVTPTEQLVTEVRALIAGVKEQVAADLTGGHYLNYVEGDERRHGVKQGTDPGTYEKLARLKARIDPDDLFDHGLDVTAEQLSPKLPSHHMGTDTTELLSLPTKTREVHNHHFDSTIWNDFRFRHDDIVIATYAKSGTTWMQQIVAQLLFGPDPHLEVSQMSPWLDLRVPHKAIKLPEVEAQAHRRFLKTHLPLDALVFSPQARYIYIGRDGRDVVWSMYHHHVHANQLWYDVLNDSPGRVGPPIEPPPADIRDYWRDWMDRDGHPFWPFWDNVRTWWAARHLPNVLFVHFADLKRDMPAQMRRIAGFLEVPVEESPWERTVEYCSFDWMKQHAHKSVPLGGAFWKAGAQTFINKGSNGRWADTLTSTEVAEYQARALAELGPDCARWLTDGGPLPTWSPDSTPAHAAARP